MKVHPWKTFWAFGLALGAFDGRAAQTPHLFPDYTGITFPPNIAPLNFRIQEAGVHFRIEISSTHGTPIKILSKSPAIQIAPKAWSNLLRANTGQPIFWRISAQTTGSAWTQFATVTNFIAPERIDSWLSYRLLTPIFNLYSHLGIYQRNLESFEQRVVLEKQEYGEGCLNCHTPLNRSPNTFAFNIRAHEGKSPVILVISNQIVRVEKTMGFLAWHPSGRWLVFSANKFSLLFHTRGETRDVYDAKSDLGIYSVDSNTLCFPSAISAPERNETWPAWSPDGRYLYFCSAPPASLENFREVRYDLMRVSFDIQTGHWGEPEVVISAAAAGRSVCQPKPSPDGRFLVVTLCEYGGFPIHQSDSDLYVLTLATGKWRRLEINSDQADTWACWSSNSRWIVFSSKRLDGLLARPYFSYVEGEGIFHKPFVLPQEDPLFYGFCLQTFNVPELLQGPVTVRAKDLARAVAWPRQVLTPAGPPAPSSRSEPAASQSGYGGSRE